PRRPPSPADALLQPEFPPRLPRSSRGSAPSPRYAAIAFTHLIGALQCPAQCPPNPKGGNSAHTVGRSNASQPGTHTGGRSKPARHDMSAWSAWSAHTGCRSIGTLAATHTGSRSHTARHDLSAWSAHTDCRSIGSRADTHTGSRSNTALHDMSAWSAHTHNSPSLTPS